MEQEIETPDKDYIKGFNDGYLIAEYLPDVARRLDKMPKDSPWLEGIADGCSQFEKDKILELTTDSMEWDIPEPPTEMPKEQDKDER